LVETLFIPMADSPLSEAIDIGDNGGNISFSLDSSISLLFSNLVVTLSISSIMSILLIFSFDFKFFILMVLLFLLEVDCSIS
jgi:hypothetical protein